MKNIPIQVIEVLEMLEKSSFEAYIVGGAVRDTLFGIIPKDYDIATNATIDQLSYVFKDYKVIETGIKHGTITILLNDLNIEITTFRDKDNTLKGDLLLRDFTINSIAYSNSTGMIDYYDGIADLNEKIIRLNGSDDSRIVEDPLRILRAIRFLACFNFEIDVKTKDYIFLDKELLNNVACERIGSEFAKIMTSSNPSKYILEYFDVFTIIIPELIPLKGFDQNNPHHIYDCLEHTLKVVESTPNDLILRLAALFHDTGKPATYTEDEKNIGHFYNHFKVSIEVSRRVLGRLKFSNDIIKRVNHIIYYHDYPLTLTNKSIKKLMNYFGTYDIDKLMTIKRADILGQSPNYRNRLNDVDRAEDMINNIIKSDECFSLSTLNINGKDLIGIGIKNGHDIGQILKELVSLVISGTISNDREPLLQKAKEIKKMI